MKKRILMKKSDLIWKIYDEKPIRKSERINGQWEKVTSIFEEKLSIDKYGVSKWICFSFSDYKEAVSAANALRQLRRIDSRTPYKYPFAWHVICNVHSYGEFFEVWACKAIRNDKSFNMKRHSRNRIQNMKIGDVVVNRVGTKYVLDGIWPDIRWGWSKGKPFCICEECVRVDGEK